MPTGAIVQTVFNGVPSTTSSCVVAGQTVTCGPFGPLLDFMGTTTISQRVVIEATAQQCGTFTNTARAEGQIQLIGGPIATYAIEDTEDITVVGCEEPPTPVLGQQGGAADGGPEVTQEVGQGSESGEVDLSFEVS